MPAIDGANEWQRCASHIRPAEAARHFAGYPAGPIRPTRRAEAILGIYDWEDNAGFQNELREEAKKGPDLAGRYVIARWSCGTWCSNAVVGNVLDARTYDTPFGGVIGCRSVTGNHNTLERRADSLLIIVRGSLKMESGEWPCGTF